MSKRPLLVLALVATAAGTAYAAMPAPAIDAAAIGPAVGSRIAMTTQLVDSAGKPTTLNAISGGHPVMIVMFRSVAWCPFCQAQLKGMAPVAAAAKAKGIRLIGVSYDKPADLATFAAKTGLSYSLYSDTGSKMIDGLKLRDAQYKPDSIAFGVPYPTTLLIDAHGRVKAKSVETNYRVRPTTTDQIAMFAKL